MWGIAGFYLKLFKDVRKTTATYFFSQQILDTFSSTDTVLDIRDTDEWDKGLAFEDLLVRRWENQIHK